MQIHRRFALCSWLERGNLTPYWCVKCYNAFPSTVTILLRYPSLHGCKANGCRVHGQVTRSQQWHVKKSNHHYCMGSLNQIFHIRLAGENVEWSPHCFNTEKVLVPIQWSLALPRKGRILWTSTVTVQKWCDSKRYITLRVLWILL